MSKIQHAGYGVADVCEGARATAGRRERVSKLVRMHALMVGGRTAVGIDGGWTDGGGH